MVVGTPDPKVYVGSVIRGRYLIEGLIGAGGFAWVLRGKTVEGRPVAVKILHSIDSDAVARFLREIKVLKALPSNRHVVVYIDDGHTVDDRPFLVLELVDGKTLMQEMNRHKRRAPRDAVVFLAELCEAFVGLHQLGVAHRDVKPENILLANDGMIKLIDFGLIKDAQGLLKLFEEEDPLESRRFSEEIDHRILIGTPEYMAPEQFSDAIVTDAAAVRTDTWSDVFSLGVILFEMISGSVPFPFNKRAPKRKAQDAIFKYMKWRIGVTDKDIPNVAGVDEALDSIVSKALRHDPRQRQPNAQTFKSDLLRYLNTGRGVRRSYDTRTVAVSKKEIEEYQKKKLAERLRAALPPSAKAKETSESPVEPSEELAEEPAPTPPPTPPPIPTPAPDALSAPDTLLGAPPWLQQPAVFSLEDPSSDEWEEPVENLLEQLAAEAEEDEEDDLDEQEPTITRSKDEPPLVVEGDDIVVDDDDIVEDSENTDVCRDTQTDVPSRDTDEMMVSKDGEVIGDRDRTAEQEVYSYRAEDPQEIENAPTEMQRSREDAPKDQGDFVIIDLPPSGEDRKETRRDNRESDNSESAKSDTSASKPSSGQLRTTAIPVRYSEETPKTEAKKERFPDDRGKTEADHKSFSDDRVATDTIPVSLPDDRASTDVKALEIPPTLVVPGSPPPEEIRGDTVPGTPEPRMQKSDTLPGAPETEKEKSDTLPGASQDKEKKSDTLPGSTPKDGVKSVSDPKKSRGARKKKRAIPVPKRKPPASSGGDDDEDIDDAVTAVKGPSSRELKPEVANQSVEVTNVFRQSESKKPVDDDANE